MSQSAQSMNTLHTVKLYYVDPGRLVEGASNTAKVFKKLSSDKKRHLTFILHFIPYAIY